MNKKIIRFLFPIITIMLVFFVGTIDVKANVDYCTWEMYQSYITKTDTGVYGVNAIDKSGNNVKFKWQLQYDRKWMYNFRIVENDTNYVKKFNSSSFESVLRNSIKCPKYVVLSATGSGDTIVYKVDVAISEEFNNYYNTQYDGILKNNSTMEGTFAYYSYFIGDISKKPIVFINSDITKYPSGHLSEIKQNNKNFNPSSFGISDCDTTCSLGIQEFYKATKAKWFNQVNSIYSNIVCENGSCIIKNRNYLLTKAFSMWFTEDIARLVFEEDYNQFLKCYKVKLLADGNISQEKFDNKINSIEEVIIIDNLNDDKDTILNNPCSSLCYYENSAAKEACEKGESYKKCTLSYNSCKNISSSSAYEQCMKSNMGEKDFANYNKKRTEVLNSINQGISDAQKKLNDYLVRIDDPDFDGITFDPEGYKVQCDDVKFLHYLYVAMRVIAPILVVLFGTLDYTKSVLGADEQKVLEARKKFPKRLALLLIFILVPVLIDTILAVFGVETSLMSCIIKGE